MKLVINEVINLTHAVHCTSPILSLISGTMNPQHNVYSNHNEICYSSSEWSQIKNLILEVQHSGLK
jgi:hypothetical protein